MTAAAPIAPRVAALLAVIAMAPTASTEELALSSLQVIQLVDAIELAFDVILPSDAITRVNFATPATIAQLLARHGIDAND